MNKVLYPLLMVVMVSIVIVPMGITTYNRRQEIKRDGCPPPGTKAEWISGTEIEVVEHSKTPGIVYGRRVGYYGSITIGCGDLKIKGVE